VTNDGWFQQSAGIASAPGKCNFSLRRNASANDPRGETGVTCFISQFGRVTQILRDETGSTFIEGVLAGEIKVPTEQELTFLCPTWRAIRQSVRSNHGGFNSRTFGVRRWKRT